MARRIDRGTLQPPTHLTNGWLKADAFITRTGVFDYLMPDGTVKKEYRAPEEVFDKESLDSFAMVPVTDDHPPVMLDSTNALKYTVGSVGERAIKDDDHMSLSLMVYDAAVIQKMKDGKVQISAGYECDLVDEPGVTPDGEKYDARQTKIRANHIAIVDRGRAGPTASVRMDAAYCVDDIEPVTPPVEKTPAVNPPPADKQKEKNKMDLDQALAEIEKLKKEKAELEAKLAAAEGTADAAKNEAEQAKTDRKDALDSMDGKIRARIQLEQAVGFLGVDVTKLKDREIKIAAVKHIDKMDIAADKSDDYVNAYFDAAIGRHTTTKKALEGTRPGLTTGNMDGGDDEDIEAKAKAKMKQRTQDAWTKPVTYVEPVKGDN